MPVPKLVKLAGVELKDVLGITIAIRTPQDGRGTYGGFTTAPTITISRRPTNEPMIEGFQFATNEDGRMKHIEGEIQLQNSLTETTYDIRFKKAYIVDWSIEDSDEVSDDKEIITIMCGQIEINAGGEGASFEVRGWS